MNAVSNSRTDNYTNVMYMHLPPDFLKYAASRCNLQRLTIFDHPRSRVEWFDFVYVDLVSQY